MFFPSELRFFFCPLAASQVDRTAHVQGRRRTGLRQWSVQWSRAEANAGQLRYRPELAEGASEVGMVGMVGVVADGGWGGWGVGWGALKKKQGFGCTEKFLKTLNLFFGEGMGGLVMKLWMWRGGMGMAWHWA